MVTFEFENVPAQSAAFLAARTTVRPSWRALEVAQDRTKEKAFFAAIGAATASFYLLELPVRRAFSGRTRPAVAPRALVPATGAVLAGVGVLLVGVTGWHPLFAQSNAAFEPRIP